MWLLLTVVVFFFARWLSQQWRSMLANPLLIAITLLIAILLWFDVPYSHYIEQNQLINYLLQPAIVALAYPLYEQLPHIRSNWRIIMLACSVGSLFSLLSTALIALALQSDMTLIASMLGKSVTTPIAMEVAQSINGEPSITAIMVMLAGLFGAIVAYPIYQLLNITHPIAKGLTMGCVSHALGTATCAEKDPRDAAFSSLSLVLCGIITSILAPMVYAFTLWLNG